jgi:ABC-type thiamin/hydroxymethylpyrimidine transport system permease subunit
VLGIIARVVAEIVVRTIKEGRLEYALDFLWIMRYQIIISGAVVGLIIGMLPLAEREEKTTKTQRTQSV